MLGKGVSGRVHVGMRQDTASLMAVKLVDVSSAVQARSLEREALVMRSVQHPNIVKYLGLESREPSAQSPLPTVRMYMQFAAAGSVAAMLKKFGPFAEPAVRVITAQILLSL